MYDTFPQIKSNKASTFLITFQFCAKKLATSLLKLNCRPIFQNNYKSGQNKKTRYSVVYSMLFEGNRTRNAHQLGIRKDSLPQSVFWRARTPLKVHWNLRFKQKRSHRISQLLQKFWQCSFRIGCQKKHSGKSFVAIRKKTRMATVSNRTVSTQRIDVP